MTSKEQTKRNFYPSFSIFYQKDKIIPTIRRAFLYDTTLYQEEIEQGYIIYDGQHWPLAFDSIQDRKEGIYILSMQQHVWGRIAVARRIEK